MRKRIAVTVLALLLTLATSNSFVMIPLLPMCGGK